MVHCTYTLVVTGYTLQNNIVIFFLKVDFVLTNSVELDEMPHYAAFRLGLHCLPKFPFIGVFLFLRGLTQLDLCSNLMAKITQNVFLNIHNADI